MTIKQITPKGLTKTGWRKVDEILAKANKEQIRLILFKCIDKLPDEVVVKCNKIKQGDDTNESNQHQERI